MATEYTDIDTLKNDYPEATDIILRENSMQCPDAKFVRAVVGIYVVGLDEDEYPSKQLIAFFDCGNPNELLWAWVPDVDDPWIDEYYDIPIDDANRFALDLK